MKPILVTCYVNPDLDGVAGSIAYCEFLQKTGHDAVVGILGEPHDEAKYILDRYNFPYPKLITNADDFNEVILVDASDLNGLEGNIDPNKVIEIIDHRKINESYKFPNAKVQIELVGSAATLVAERFIENNIDISKESAILICGAIISNTLNFKGGVTTERDKKVFEYLNRVALLSDNFWKEIFQAKSDLSGNKLKERIEGDFAWFSFNNKKIGIAQIEIIGAEKLIKERIEEIIKTLEKIKIDMKLDYIFQNTIELEFPCNYFISADLKAQKLLETVLDIKFDSFIAKRPNLIMRKQIVPLLKDELEK
jgi:manganese-dependent inorganic pyrophosphatase